MKSGRPDIPNAPERFHEDKATYTVKGDGTSDIEAGVAAIRQTVKSLPARPGVYRMHDARGDILYVGKAASLKSRVPNYANIAQLPRRLQRMVAQTRSMTIVTTNTEAEALLLEAQLIKRYRPPYNVLLRDDKSFPFILLREDHDFPRITKHRGARRAKGQYYGPFASAGSVNRTINALQKTFLLRSCTDSFFSNRSRPCLLYQIRRCSAPCVGRIDAPGYDELVDDAKAFLSGKSTEIQQKLGAQMEAAAAKLDFEMAAVYRDRLKSLTFIQSSHALTPQNVTDADVFALAAKGGVVGIQAFFIRGGQNWGHRSFFPAHVKDVPEDEAMQGFLMQFYEEVPPPRLILLDRELAEADLLAEALTERADRKVVLKVPRRGDQRKMLDQARRNAGEALDRRLAESSTQARIMRELTEMFELDDLPDRIEIYDNSHVQGAHAVGAMVVAGPEGFRKNHYRKFNIKNPDTAPGDDFAMMREVLRRRFARAEKEDPDRKKGEWPDLVLIDGGKGQISSVCDTLEEMGISDVPIIGISKGPDRHAGREHFHFPDGREQLLPPNNAVLFYLQRLRDEAHRFAIGAHRAKRSKAMGTSPLDAIPGIGPARKRALLLHFGTAKAVRAAGLDDIERVAGVSKAMARSIYDHFHAGG